MTRIIGICITILVGWVGWIIYEQWSKTAAEQELSQVEYDHAHAAVEAMNPRTLHGIPDKMRDKMEDTLQKAQQNGAVGLREWLKIYSKFVEDPRLGWIQLDYAVLVARDSPGEAKRVFHEVKDRTPPTSPIYPRIKLLEKAYE